MGATLGGGPGITFASPDETDAAICSICFVVSRRRSEYFRSMRTAISGLLLIMSPKRSLPMTMRSPSSSISAPAERGMRSRIAISPKKSPFSRTARVVSPWGTRFLMATFPDWMMYISSPSSPSLNSTVPFLKWFKNLAKGFFSALMGVRVSGV